MSLKYEWHRRSLDSIHGGALTNSKRAEMFIKNVYPTHVTHGSGCYLSCADKKRYIDFICALGTNLFGYNNQRINNAIQNQLTRGSVFSLGSTLEVECAEIAKSIFPWINKVRFLKTGTEACLAAIRIARAHTGRKIILSDGYHGWSDEFVSLTDPAIGIIRGDNIFPLSGNEHLIKEAAAVILEPIIVDHSPERITWLSKIKEETRKNRTILIFDEIITGFRWPKYCVSNDIGIFPDIICVGKAMGGGLPLSMIGTAREVGESTDWFVSGTFYGDCIALAAFREVVYLLNNVNKIDHLWKQGDYFKTEFNKIAPELIFMDGYPTRGIFKFKNELTKALFFQESCKAGLLVGSSWFFNFPHIEIIDIALNSFKDILLNIKNNNIDLEGPLPSVPFAQKQRG